MRVLVIDDSRAMRMILKTALLELGHEVSEAPNGQEGLNQVRQAGPFALALVLAFATASWSCCLTNID